MVKYIQIIKEDMRLRIVTLVLVGIFSITSFTFAEMSSPSYQIDWDTVSTGGSDSGSSSSYKIKDTAGNSGAGVSTSTSFSEQAGYRSDYIPHITTTPPSGGGSEPVPTPEPEEEDACLSDVVGPIASSISTSAISAASATISWSTNESAPGHVDYGTTTMYATGTESEVGETSHTVYLSGLAASTTYYFQIETTDICGNTTTSSGYSFTTTEADVAPANVTSFTATAGDGSVSLSWVLPTDSDFGGTLIIYCLGGFPSSHADTGCSTIYSGTGTSYIHSGLTNGTVYYYGAFSYDTGGHYASGALTSATPTITEEEPIEEPIEEPDEEPIDEPIDETGGEETGSGETGGTTDSCGDGICSETEDSFYCPSDCPSIEIPDTTVTEEELIPFSDISAVSGEGEISLNISETDGVTVLADTDLSFFLSKENIDKEISEVILTLGADTYLLQDSDLYYFTTIAIPTETADYAVYLIVNYQDGSAQTFSLITKSTSWGLIFEKEENNNIPVSGATITLYQFIDGDWKTWTPRSGQSNPVSSSDSGTFAWYAENGTYKILVSKDGYEEETRTLTITNNIVNPTIEITKKTEIPVKIENITQSITETITETVSEVVTTITETFEAIKESQTVQNTATVAAPAVTVMAITSTVVLATSFSLLQFLQYLFTAPVLLFGRRKRKAYGVVYNAFTKTPIDLALVRLYSVAENKLIRSRVTDKEGKYFFLVQPGKYRININKSGYEFPSSTLSNVKDDAIFLDVYHGEEIEVTEKDVVITPNIPIEPLVVDQRKEISSVKKIRALRKLQYRFAFIGILVSLSVFLIQMSIWTGTVLGIQIVVYLLVRRLATSKKPKSWGIVYDQKTQRPIGNVVVRIFEPKYHKLLETGITDNKGRYTFLLGPNEYSSTFEKGGYESAEINPINYSQEKETKEWAQNIALSPKNKTVSDDAKKK